MNEPFTGRVIETRIETFAAGATFSNGYSEEDVKEAFEAGIELINREWHMQEFHGPSCKCTPLKYQTFEEWIKLYNERK